MNPYNYINSLPLFGSEDGYKPGLERIKRLLFHLGNPEQKLKVIHLAGTNGKGSTAAILERIYREAGYKTALYTSPHIFHFNERMKIRGEAITTTELTELAAELKKAAAELEAEEFAQPSFFEVVTALAFKYFQRHEAEIVILETGLGGRLDATNVCSSPLLSLITNISLEHSQFLGDNIAQIAAEKGGIIKENSPVITSVEQKEALDVLAAEAEAKSSEFIDLRQEYDEIKAEGSLTENIIRLKRKNQKEESYQLSLLGRHQALNTALALRAVEAVQNDFPVTKKEIEKALKDVYWPGRMQKILSKPAVILDAAHNPAAFKEILASFADYREEYKKLHFVFSILNDKNLAEILKEFAAVNLEAEFYLAENSSFRSISAAELKSKADQYGISYQFYPNLARAADAAYQKADQADVIAAAGSFNTVFEAGISFISKKFRGGQND